MLLDLTVPVVDHSAAAVLSSDVTESGIRSVAEAIAGVADPRRAWGIRHGGFGLLMGVLVALLAGARTRVEIAEHVQDLTAWQRARIGLTWKNAASLSTIRRFLLVLDESLLQTALTAWAEAHALRVAVPVGVRVNWSSVGPREIFRLSEKMFDAAKVPQFARDSYYAAFNR